MRKKLIRAVLCAAMAAFMLTGCGDGSADDSKSNSGQAEAKNTDSGNGTYDKFITVDVYDDLANYQGVQSGWFAKIIKDKFNMELNIISPNVAGGGETLYQTRSAAGDLGDLIVLNTSNGKLNNLVSSGLVMDCTDLMAGKDIAANYEPAIKAASALAEDEGMWAFPSEVSSKAATEPSEGVEPTFGPYIRWDYYKELGYPEMKSLDDFLDVLEDMQKLAREKEGAKDIYALSLFKDWDGNLMNTAKQPACMYGYDEIGFILAKADGSDYQSITDEDSNYVQVLKFFYEANQRGLIDPDSTTQNYDTLSTKYREGKVLYSPWSYQGPSLYNTEDKKAAGKGFMFAPVEDMKIFSAGSRPEGNINGVIAIGSKAEDPGRLADFIDWLYSPEGARLNGQANGAAGVEGLTWEINADGKPQLTEFGKSALPQNEVEVPKEYGGGNWKDGVSTLNFKTVNLTDSDPQTGEPYDYTMWETYIENNNSPLFTDWREHMGAETTMDYLKQNDMLLVAPGASYTAPESDSDITTIRNQCKSIIVDNSWKMAFAASETEFDSALQSMKETVNGLGYEDVLEVDKKNAKDQQTAREKAAKDYPEDRTSEIEEPKTDTAESDAE